MFYISRILRYLMILHTYSREIVCWDPSKWNSTAWNHLSRSVSNRDRHKGKYAFGWIEYFMIAVYTSLICAIPKAISLCIQIVWVKVAQ